MKKIAVGILAHVDAGKTTLSEGLLYHSGALTKLGRVDKRDAFLDTHSLERERGITIFSKQAILEFGNTYMTLIDTPGHIDFSCEAERALSVQDYAVLIISADDGVTAHTKTLWHLLASRRIPTFIFVNKTDISAEIPVLPFKNTVFISAKSGDGIEDLVTAVAQMFGAGNINESDEIVVNARQCAAIVNAAGAVESAVNALNGFTQDVAGMDIELALSALAEADGRTVSEDIVNEIFSHFCVGK